MSPAKYLKRHWCAILRRALGIYYQARGRAPELPRSVWESSLRDPNGFYFKCLAFFHCRLPVPLREHRLWFGAEQRPPRGYGEHVFHVMWFLLLNEFKPAQFLEIGVFRGQVISLVALWSKLTGHPCEVCGISPFSSAGDRVSSYAELDYYCDTLANFDAFGLSHPRLLKACSTDPEALNWIASREWDMVYIDGSHEFEIVCRDWETCSRHVKPGGIIVLDDAGLSTTYQPPIIASGGHPGPSQVAREIDHNEFREILQVGHNRVFQRNQK